MAITSLHNNIFKKGSKTFYNSSRFFPEDKREDIFILYGFVRTADDFVDCVPQNKEAFYAFKTDYELSQKRGSTGNPIIDSFNQVSRKYHFDPSWAEAFLKSMEMDLYKQAYNTLEEILEYIYGSAEVIGLFMSSIMELPEESFYHACMQGRAMQYINFIRDIKEDLSFGRRYLPLENTSLKNLEPSYIQNNIEEFISFHRKQIVLYEGWQKEAEKGYHFIPRQYLIPIKTAAKMYMWSANKIKNNPLIVYEKKVKPPKIRILFEFLRHLIGF